MSVSETSVSEMSVSEMSVSEMSVSETSVSEMNVHSIIDRLTIDFNQIPQWDQETFADEKLTVFDVINTIIDYFDKLQNNVDATVTTNIVDGLTEKLKTKMSMAGVFFVLRHHSVSSISDQLRSKLAEIECRQELDLARSLLSDPCFNFEKLSQTECYVKTYHPLVESELSHLCNKFPKFLDKTHLVRIVFVGSGALPMTAILLAVNLNCQVVCLDNNHQAVTVSRQIVEKIGLSDKITINETFAEDFIPNRNDLIWIAILTTNKETIIQKYSQHISSDALIAVRSVDGLFSLLYVPLDRTAVVSSGFEELGKNTKNLANINDIIYYRKI